MTAANMKTLEWLEDSEIRSEYGSATHKYDVAAALVAARKLGKLTQAELANIAGVSQAYIAKLESGEANPTIGRIGAILASIWLKAQIKIVPLVPPERQASTTSAFPSPMFYGGVGGQSTANDMQHNRICNALAFEQLDSSYFGQFEQRGAQNATV